MGLVCAGIGVGNGKKERVGAGLTVPAYAKRDGADRSPRIVSWWIKCADSIPPLPFAAVYVGATGTAGQHVESICYRGEFVTIVTVIVIVLIIAGKIFEEEAGFQVVARQHSVVYQIRIYVRGG